MCIYVIFLNYQMCLHRHLSHLSNQLIGQMSYRMVLPQSQTSILFRQFLQIMLEYQKYLLTMIFSCRIRPSFLLIPISSAIKYFITNIYFTSDNLLGILTLFVKPWIRSRRPTCSFAYLVKLKIKSGLSHKCV